MLARSLLIYINCKLHPYNNTLSGVMVVPPASGSTQLMDIMYVGALPQLNCWVLASAASIHSAISIALENVRAASVMSFFSTPLSLVRPHTNQSQRPVQIIAKLAAG